MSFRSPTSPQRRLSDKLRATIHEACNAGAVEIAAPLLEQLQAHVHQPSNLPAGRDRRQPEDLQGPAERIANLLLWRLEEGACGHES